MFAPKAGMWNIPIAHPIGDEAWFAADSVNRLD
jgi:hypothetical protein